MSAFGAQHYIAVSRQIRPLRDDTADVLAANPGDAVATAGLVGVDASVHVLAALFEADNARFNRERFLSACGLTPCGPGCSSLAADHTTCWRRT